MAKGDDALRRKKNKVNRKKMRADTSSKVSARVAAIIASKQRRKNGKRRMCEGMCFSLPSPEDPFNDKYNQKKVIKKDAHKPAALQTDAGESVTQKSSAPRKDATGRQRNNQKDKSVNVNFEEHERHSSFSRKDQRNPIQQLETNNGVLGNGGANYKQRPGIHGNSDGPSKFLTLCLRALQDALLDKNMCNGNSKNPLFLNRWGAEFLACSLLGTDILETTGASSSVEQIAWMASIAADIITTKEKEGVSVPNPFLLILVPSKEKAIQVRSLCKPLKPLGIHTVSLHTGASLDHQKQGLRSCEPEFLVSTPERLLELVSAEAIDLSDLSFLVVDGLGSFAKDGLLEPLKAIKQSVLRASLTVVFCDNFGSHSTSAVKTLLDGPITRLCHSDSIASQSACISQCVHMCALQEKSSKGIKVLNEECGKRLCSSHFKVLFVEETSCKASTSAALLVAEGYSILTDDLTDNSEVPYSKEKALVRVTDLEQIEEIDLDEFEIVVITSFPPELEDYVRILTEMARQSVNGVLHSCFCEEDAPLSGQLIEILEQCDQNVPEFLRSWHNSVSMSEH